MGPFAALRRRREGIPREIYSADYFLSDRCEGYREFLEGGGVSYLKAKLVERIAPGPDDRILEIGCGRGEVLADLARRGAWTVGIDYASDATRLSLETCGPDARIAVADATALPFGAGAFTAVFLGDVLEHLTHTQAKSMLEEAARVLVADGRLVIHTSPNVLFVRLVFPVVLLAFAILGRFALVRMLVAQYRTIRRFHVREYSHGRLERLLGAAPFRRHEVTCDPDVLRGGRSRYTESLAGSSWMARIGRLVGREPLVRLFSNDLWATASSPLRRAAP